MKRLAEQADYIATLEPDFEALSDEELRRRPPSSGSGSRTARRSTTSSSRPTPPSARPSSARIGPAHLRRPVMGGIVLHEGDIAEMKTGEGKTLRRDAAALPERARRDGRPPRHRQRLPREARRGVDGAVYERARACASAFIQNMMPFAERKAPTSADITYGTNSEFGFDYLRDNMAVSLEARPARPRLRDRGRGRLDPGRRGAHAADHLGRARDRRADLLRLRPRREAARRRPREGRRRSRTSPTRDYLTTRSTRRSRRPRARSRRSSGRSRSTTSTTRATCSSSTT